MMRGPILFLVIASGVWACGKATSNDARTSPRAATTSHCGHAICQATEYCCNASCSVCTPTGGACTSVVCVEDHDAQ